MLIIQIIPQNSRNGHSWPSSWDDHHGLMMAGQRQVRYQWRQC
nr:MAG TPA: hypothetical protein [Caudoviricetes sp.]